MELIDYLLVFSAIVASIVDLIKLIKIVRDWYNDYKDKEPTIRIM